MMFGSLSKFQGSQKTEGKMCKRWQLFHATDFQSLMYPCFFFCCILGIFPYKINASTFEASKLRYILLIILLCVLCICELIILHKINFAKTVDFGGVSQTIEANSYYILGGFIAIVTYVLSAPRMRILQAILEISSILSPEYYQKLSKWIHIKEILGIFFIVIQGCVFYFRVPECLICHVLGIYISLLIFCMDMQYINCVYVLKACFKSINDNLLHLQSVMLNKLYAPRLICNTQKNQFLLIELKTLEKQHLIVSNTTQTLNVIFSLQLLATTTMTFIDITFEIYSHVMRWQDGLSIILDDETRNVFFLTSIAWIFLKFILIVWVCETSKNEAINISTTIHDVLNCTSDEQVKKEVEKKCNIFLKKSNICIS